MAPRATADVIAFLPDEPVPYPPGFGPIPFDIDGDGTIDFDFPNTFSAMEIVPRGLNRSLIDEQFGDEIVSALMSGDFIGAEPGAGMVWDNHEAFLGGCASGGGTLSCPGNFLDGLDIVGLEFDIAGQTHYGWIEIESFDRFGPVNFQRWAYESDPGVGILAGAIPEPSTALLLVIGTLTCLLGRRRMP
jgi:hypothetical protein